MTPPGGGSPILIATTGLTVVRFHGHSTARASGDEQEKFPCAYGERELRQWSGLLRELSDQCAELHVLTNNCCGDQAQRGAARLAALLGVEPAGISPAA